MFADLAFNPITGRPAVVHLPWPSPDPEGGQVRFLHWDGMTWQGETIAQGDVLSPDLVYNDAGTPYISYVTGAMGTLPTTSLWVAHFDDNNWVHELVDNDVNGTSVDLCMDPNGSPTLSYGGNTGESFGLKFAFKETP